MMAMVIMAVIFMMVFASMVAVVVAYNSLALNRTPKWVENAYTTIEKIFMR